MRKNRINLRELKEVCRENGIENIHLIDLAILEVDGKISIIQDEKIEKGSRFDVDEDTF
ncbi:MAG: DUF421 domain-containing protein [Tannerellaceae bacterium]|nr:DUF421 domain-containing protein [Tannerellaceae bacterium]